MPPPITSLGRRLAATALVVVGVLVGVLVVLGATALPAAADAPGNSDYESVLTDVSPSTDAVEVAVTGAGAVFDLRVGPGHEVVVLGYEDEPYLRISADGTVEANLESPATYANASSSGETIAPTDIDPSGPPRWDEVGSGGHYAWHDHRIHWMSTQPPSGVARGELITDWTVPLEVDGEAVTVSGTLTYAEPVAWWPWPLAVVGFAGAGWLLARRSAVVGVLAAGVACALGLVLSGVEQLSIPADIERRLLPVLTPAVGAVVAVAALVMLARRRRPSLAVNVGLGAVAAAVGWGLLRLSSFTKPVLVTDLSPTLDRLGTAAVLGLSFAAALSLIRNNAKSRGTKEAEPATSPA
jgi:hypothetical protein